MIFRDQSNRDVPFILQSSYPTRQKRCQEILNHAQLKTPEMSKLIKDFHKLWERLIELSNKTIPDVSCIQLYSSLTIHDVKRYVKN